MFGYTVAVFASGLFEADFLELSFESSFNSSPPISVGTDYIFETILIILF